MRKVFNEFGKLKEVIVGRELLLAERNIDTTFKLFFGIDKKHQYFNRDVYNLTKECLYERIEDLDNLAKLLESLGIRVIRPNAITKITPIKTPYWSGTLSGASNVRDTILTYSNKIIETPPLIRNRYFENLSLYEYFTTCMLEGSILIKAINSRLSDKNIDIENWKIERNFTDVNLNYDMGIDAAQYIKVGKDIICNISTHNHYLGAKWLETILPEANIHYLYNVVDNHLDGALLPLREGVFLLNTASCNKNLVDLLPAKFKKWQFLEIKSDDVNINTKKMEDLDVLKLASEKGMDMNVLSIDENTVLVNEDAYSVINLLEKNKFNVIPVKLRHSILFGGGLHCSTLDMDRE